MHDTRRNFLDMPNRSRERGERLRAYRERRGFSQERVARELDVSVKTVGNWERGTGIRPENLHAVASLYGLPVEDLQDHVEIPSPFKLKDEINEMLDEFRVAFHEVREHMAEQDREREALTAALQQQSLVLAEFATRFQAADLLSQLDAVHEGEKGRSGGHERRVRVEGRRETDHRASAAQ